MGAEERAEDAVTDREKYLARQQKYNQSAKGRARYRSYWHRHGLTLHRQRLNSRDQEAITELMALHPWLGKVLG
jgi:hypothetical protein